MGFVDDFLNRITMYRLVLYYLVGVWGLSLLFSFFGVLPFAPVDFIFSSLLILCVSWVTNKLFASAFSAMPNVESVYITAFILSLIITPVAFHDIFGIGFLVFASAWAMASKYLLALGKKHLFNPAAFGIAVSAFALGHSATWWVGGNLFLLPFVFVGGLLIVRKIRRFDLVLAFVVIACLTIMATGRGSDALTTLGQALQHTPIFFLGFVMLTEPLTMPAQRWSRMLYGAIVGFLFAPNVHFGAFYLTPELALLVGNLFAFAVNRQGRFLLTLIEKRPLVTGSVEYVFAPDRPLRFASGQYVEWTLPHSPSDNRGNRRFFTIASSPSEEVVRLGVKFYNPASTFKRALYNLPLDAQLSVSHVAGDFVLPHSKKKKLAFIAGGIGITPFRSMVQHMLDIQDARDAILLYSNNTVAEIAYKEIFDRAAHTIGLKIVYALTNEPTPVAGMHHGMIDAELLKREIPDFRERTFYLSGPRGMVDAFRKTLRELGVSRWRIKTDYFPGFA